MVELPARDAVSDLNSDVGVERCVVLQCSYALLVAWTGLTCLVGLIEVFLPMSGQVLDEDSVKPSGGVDVRDRVSVPV